MVDQASSSITVDAGKAQVMQVIADFPAYPQWTGSIKKVEVLDAGSAGRARQVRFWLDAGVIKDEYTLEYAWDGDDEVSWRMVEGKALKAQQGSYRLVETAGRTEVTYSLAVELNIPMLGMFKRKAEKMIMDTALKELKRRVES